VFCIKGGSNEFYEYFPSTDSWAARASVPRCGSAGRSARCKKGAALVATDAGLVYAFKGGGCNEFWSYEILPDTWIQADDLPLGAGYRRVDRGADLTWNEGRIYALKGGCREFWRYDPEVRFGTAGTAVPVLLRQQPCSPRPTSGYLSEALRPQIRLSSGGSVDVVWPGGLSPRGNIEVRDILGRRQSCCLTWDGGRLRIAGLGSSGVYFLRADSDRPPVRITILR